jgi:hypothetical protein
LATLESAVSTAQASVTDLVNRIGRIDTELTELEKLVVASTGTLIVQQTKRTAAYNAYNTGAYAAANTAKTNAADAVATGVDDTATIALGNLQADVLTTAATLATARSDATDAAGEVTSAAAGLQGLRDAVDSATATWDEKQATLAGYILAVAGAHDEYELAKAARMAAVEACQEAAYDTFRSTLLTEMTQRATDLETIKALLADQEANKPAMGAAGARCEKAISNGTYRPRMSQGREMVCDEGLCCGAARIW